ncbi:endolytic transglycosylase MltG [Scopulibacillus darangshiensis]|uniref:endolytic transglycosylase MltG n=1 Tax=Scopulibacillus darangshiensis TaxID=442528 RepID=UPI00140544E3|nr:endolytic transglycosylase MltG [Scopulibacillus darangshiensis]
MSDSDDRFKPIQDRTKGKKRVRRLFLSIIICFIIFVLAAAGAGYYYVHRALQPVNAASHKKITVIIPRGASAAAIGNILEDQGVIRNGLVFQFYSRYKNETGLKAGTYLLSPSMTVSEIVSAMQSGKQKAAVVLSIPEGFWVKDIARRIAKQTDLNEKDILNKMRDRKYIENHYMKEYPFLKDEILNKEIKYPLEGYLFPATYSFYKKNPSLDDMIRKMLDKTQAILKKYDQDIQESQLGSVHKILTMASLLEEEASTTKHRKEISGVFYNRLQKGMRLQTDPTISYAKQKHLVHTYYKDLDIKSPYNTYRNKGLPVGPIDNPSESAIKAALNPVSTNYLYFFARPNGEVIFSKTYKEHQAVVKKYGSEWDKIKNKGE